MYAIRSYYDRVGERRVPVDHVGPGRAQRVREVGDEDVRAGVQPVHDRPALGRTDDLDPAALELARRRSDLPLRGSHVRRLGQEARRITSYNVCYTKLLRLILS